MIISILNIKDVAETREGDHMENQIWRFVRLTALGNNRLVPKHLRLVRPAENARVVLTRAHTHVLGGGWCARGGKHQERGERGQSVVMETAFHQTQTPSYLRLSYSLSYVSLPPYLSLLSLSICLGVFSFFSVHLHSICMELAANVYISLPRPKYYAKM